MFSEKCMTDKRTPTQDLILCGCSYYSSGYYTISFQTDLLYTSFLSISPSLFRIVHTVLVRSSFLYANSEWNADSAESSVS